MVSNGEPPQARPYAATAGRRLLARSRAFGAALQPLLFLRVENFGACKASYGALNDISEPQAWFEPKVCSGVVIPRIRD